MTDMPFSKGAISYIEFSILSFSINYDWVSRVQLNTKKLELLFLFILYLLIAISKIAMRCDLH